MFLFTTPGPAAGQPASGKPGPTDGVVDAIRAGSQRSGADFEYLLRTARRESSLDPTARARTSSASGLFQFIEQTWLGVVKGAGQEHGLGQYAQAITEVRPGLYDVSDPQTKAQILSLRNDPQTAAIIAGELTKQNAQRLSGLLGRAPTDGELYVAHVMGASGAADLIRAAQSRPSAPAPALFPDQAGANRSIFYDKASGRPRTVAEVYAVLAASGSSPGLAAKLPADPRTWSAGALPEEPVAAPAYAPGGPAIYGLFRTEGARGPLNQTVQKIWSGVRASSVSDVPSYFPRTASPAGSVQSDAPQPGTSPLARPGTVAPLPPERPAGLEVGGVSTSSRGPARRRGPLDLLAFLKPKVSP